MVILTRQEQATATALGREEMYERRSDEGVVTPLGSSGSLPRTLAIKRPTLSMMTRSKNASHASLWSQSEWRKAFRDELNDKRGLFLGHPSIH